MAKIFLGPVAQWIEQRFPKPRVGRSTRLGAARDFKPAPFKAGFFYDAGSSSVRTFILEAEGGKIVASAISPLTELVIVAGNPGWIRIKEAAASFLNLY